jgi:hypothetical protein
LRRYKWVAEREWRAYQREQKQKIWEASIEERKARDEARKAGRLLRGPTPSTIRN